MTNPITVLYTWSHLFLFWPTHIIWLSTLLPLYCTIYCTLFLFSYSDTQGLLVMSTYCVQCLIVGITRTWTARHVCFAVCLSINVMKISRLNSVWINWNFRCSVTGLTVAAMDVAVPRTNIREDARGNPVLSFYVQFSSSVFLSADTLATAVMVSSYFSPLFVN